MTSEFNTISVFISSLCSNEDPNYKYNQVRDKIKTSLEKTKLFKVYTYETAGGSTATVRDLYVQEEKDSDVCIFLIDNVEGISEGCQVEINIAKKYNKKSLYYFCDENSKEITGLQKQLRNVGPNYSVVHRFDDFDQSVRDLVNDVLRVYHWYCKNQLQLDINDFENNTEMQLSNVAFNPRVSFVPKSVLKNISLSSHYVYELLSYTTTPKRSEIQKQLNQKISHIDSLACSLLAVLFDPDVTIDSFNTAKLIEEIKKLDVSDDHLAIINVRWKAIEKYFEGDQENCIAQLKESLKLAREKKMSEWIINDILIDLRNQEQEYNWTRNIIVSEEAQQQLEESEEGVNYPLLDRFDKNLYQELNKKLERDNLETPYINKFGSTDYNLAELLVSGFIVAMLNGSLTHLQTMYTKITDIQENLAIRDRDNWHYCVNLTKFSMFNRDKRTGKYIGFQYPNFYRYMDNSEAEKIISFCANEPIYILRMQSFLTGMQIVGLYLDDSDFLSHEEELSNMFHQLMKSENPCVSCIQDTLICLEKLHERFDQEFLAEVCITCIEKGMLQFTKEILNLACVIDVSKLKKETSVSLLNGLCQLIDNHDNLKSEISSCLGRIISFINNNKETAVVFREAVEKRFGDSPDFLMLQTHLSDEPNRDWNRKIPELLENIKTNIQIQGHGEHYVFKYDEIKIIRDWLSQDNFTCKKDLAEQISDVMRDELIESEDTIKQKAEAAQVLLLILLRYPDVYLQKEDVFQEIYKNRDNLLDYNRFSLGGDYLPEVLNLSLSILFIEMGKDERSRVTVSSVYVGQEVDSLCSAEKLITDYLVYKNFENIPELIQQTALQLALLGIEARDINVKTISAILLLLLLEIDDFKEKDLAVQNLMPVLDQHIYGVDNNIIFFLQKSNHIPSDIRTEIINKCKFSSDYRIRMKIKPLLKNES